MFKWNSSFLILFLFIFGFSHAQEYPGFRVKGRHLYAPEDELVILRGVANPNIWYQKSGLPHYNEIDDINANVIRIVWEISGSANDLDSAITNCIALDMIPMIECHDATGNWSMLDNVVDYWTSEAILPILIKHEAYLLLNIANEAGDGNIRATAFNAGYEAAIQQIRNAGVHVPLVIDAPDWGKNINVLQATGPGLIEFDPDHNLIFSIHMWWPKMYGYDEQDIIDEIAESVEMELPLIVGEFSQMHGQCNTDVITDNNSIAYLTIIEQCQLNQMGYIAWSWFGNCNPFWDMCSDGTYATLYDWGLKVAVTDPNSIQNTSVRPDYILNGNWETSIPESTVSIPAEFEMAQAFPNPFNASTEIQYTLSKSADVQFLIFDIQGRLVQSLNQGRQSEGRHLIRWSGHDHSGAVVPSGAYFCMIQSGHEQQVQKLMLMK